MTNQNNILKRIKKLTQEKTGIQDLKQSNKRTVLTKMCIAYIGFELYGISKKRIAEELNTSGRLIRYYVSTFPHELKINPEFRNFVKEINEHPDLNKEYFNRKCKEALGLDPLWNEWIQNHRFLCVVGNIVMDPDISKLRSEILYQLGYNWIAWDLIDLQDDEKINHLIKYFKFERR